MSYELNAMIYHKGKSISKEFNVNFLKSINETRYAVDLLIEPIRIENNFHIFNYNSFSKLYDILENNYINAIKKMEKIKNIPLSQKQYYLEGFLEELDYQYEEAKEALDNNKYGMIACSKILGIFDFFEDLETNIEDLEIYIYAE